ncbi:hypothetical protein SAMN04487895_101515 [Paenibacillus sophorae]|uniref:Uncharacterized protein n=1 Tax=Paenibacillus sophorae TaxID=1333845 RepID=A0A1H8GHU9_9BACL|nr:hypothetical protein [Paenibacillus sophorae]QWU14224.1 hypothetical protein KP014_20145 [Paenibacillus sophorae]SEN43379.1 hypothetical protein SAMN04487895_101515 [Paenibacillus sophorae]
MRTYISLSDALYECFKNVVGLEEEYLLHEDSFVKKKLKEFIGAKEFKKFDALDEKSWYEAWREFDVRVFHNNLNK